jgi:L-threonylcarbamoyladenylate synthase
MLFEFSENKLKTAVLTIGIKEFQADCNINLGFTKNDIAKNLFKALRSCDNLNVDIILTEAINSKGLGLAIMNRLEKAALYHVIKL